MPFEVRFYIYWSQTDAAGIVHFSEFFSLVEHAEEEFYRARGVLEIHSRMPRVEAYAVFKSPLRRGDVARVVLKPLEIREKAVKYGFEIYNETTGALSATGHIVAVCVENEGGRLKSTRCPQELVDVWRSIE
ncbi:thioesterase superfamily protein [Pyrobaculum islandicum DSM 4184]|uniref:Thioesterase superfamily protein n=1 Tax=Pyrobaculum islandicum (strain DSM 4184 / JCM 9189 / GEO3) TaxID=384616 RepID=A1RQV5_PYRIL|nr:thioesterase family protein [Pyrobaculum islandicum]ABL87337.1 thioesterase superfamily protein [Pyrobaculum islandicum DSM 4184]